MSAPKPEDTKPSVWVGVFWWVVFIIPVGFTYFATQSFVLPVMLVVIRVVIMFVPIKWIPFIKKEKEPEPTKPSSVGKKTQQPLKQEETINKSNPLLSSIKDEIKTEWKGLLKMLHIYDYDKEEAYLKAYRKLRGWE